MTSASRNTSASSASPLRLLLYVALGGVGVAALAVAVVIAMSPKPARTVSEVEREFSRILLTKSERPDVEDGGPMGPWWVAATSFDPSIGAFTGFRLNGGTVRLAAREARLIIDPDEGTFRFDLRDVVLTSSPDSRQPGDVIVTDLPQYTLGPAPLRGRIVRDASPYRSPSILPPSLADGKRD